MTLKTTLFSAALAVSALVPTAAFADDDEHSVSFGMNRNGPYAEVHVHGSGCRHDTLPPQPPSGVPVQTGRYELVNVDQWVPGRYEQVFVPGQCVTRHKRHKTKTVCSEGYYQSQWVEGRYVTAQQWVWVDHPAPRPQYGYGYGRHGGGHRSHR